MKTVLRPEIQTLKRAFNDSGKTVPQLAAETGLSKSTIYQMFRGVGKSPTTETVEALAIALGVQVLIGPRKKAS